MTDTATLLQEYARTRSEEAFRQLVEQHLRLVYSTALRVVNGDAHLARDLAQIVFSDLARKASSLPRNVVLGGWLHRHTFFVASQAIRTERRRQAREQEALAMEAVNDDSSESVWHELAPVLDEALTRLPARERDVLVLRFFEEKPLKAIGTVLEISEDAARKRVDRAMANLRTALTRAGVTVSATALIAALAHSGSAAPAGGTLAALASSCVPAGFNSASGGTGSLLTLLASTKTAALLLSLIFVAGMATPSVVHQLGKQHAITANNMNRAQDASGGAARNTDTARKPASVAIKQETALERLTAWVRDLDRTHQPFEPWSMDENELRFLIWSLPAADFSKAWQLREGLRYEEIKKRLANNILPLWAELDPKAALTAASSLGEFDYAYVKGVLEVWCKKEPAAALAWAEQSVAPKYRLSVIKSLVPQIAETNPRLALATLNQIPAGSARQQTLRQLLETWAAHAPADAAQYIAESVLERRRTELIKTVGQSWAQHDPEAAWEWGKTLDQKQGREAVMSSALFALAAKDPEQAAAIFENLEGTEARLRRSIPTTIVESWAKTDIKAAAEYMKQLWQKNKGDSEDGNADHGFREVNLKMAADALMRQWCQQDISAAADFAQTIEEPKTRQQQMESVAAKWVSHDPDAAMAWAKAMPEGSNEKNAAFKGISNGLASTDPAKAASLVANMPPGQMQSDAAQQIVYRWAFNDPQAAAQWATSFPEGETRDRAIGRLIDGWVVGAQDAHGAAQWLAAQPAGQLRDLAARSFVCSALMFEPQLAATWVDAFTDEKERNLEIETIASSWLMKDREAAATWLQSTTLPEETKRKLLER